MRFLKGQVLQNLQIGAAQYPSACIPCFIIIYFLCVGMGNGEFEVPQHVTDQWTEVYRNNKKYLQNKITLEKFQFMVLEKLTESTDISHLIQRSIYSIPKTPKIIILNDLKGQLFILVQDSDQPLAQHLSKIPLTVDILELLTQTFTVFHRLYKKYGSFGITEGMIGLNADLEILAWINENKQRNQVQIPIQNNEGSERIMITQIVNIFKKHSRGLLWQQELSSHKNFDSVQKQLTKMIKKRKIEAAYNCAQIKNKGENFRRALSPQTSLASPRRMEIKSPKVVEGNCKLYKKYNVPNFLKRMSDKKINFLDALHHKRTVTIDQAENEALSKQKAILELSGQKRQKCSSKSLTKIKSLKVSPSKDLNSNYSGQITKASFPTSGFTDKTYDLLTQSGSSSNYVLKKRQFQGVKTGQTANNWKFQSFPPKSTANNFQVYPNHAQIQSGYWQINGQSCLFQALNNQLQTKPQIPLGCSSKVPLLAMCNNTTVSSYFNEPNFEKDPIIEEDSQSISRNMQDEVNDFFSNHSKSPRYMIQVHTQSNELMEEFSKIIDF